MIKVLIITYNLSLMQYIMMRIKQVPADFSLNMFEITNYHQCRFTNAAVEGKNNKIKALQRRSYFLRNRTSYEYRIYLECNCEFLPA